MGVQGLFPLAHWHSCALIGCSWGVQYSLNGVQAHCQILKQMRSFAWSHLGELHSIMTQWRSCTLNGCSHTLNCVHAHSMGVQGLFPLTKWLSCTLNGCSGAVQYSRIGIHVHSQVFRRCSIRVQPVHVPEGPMNMFSNLRSMQRPYKLALNFH